MVAQGVFRARLYTGFWDQLADLRSNKRRSAFSRASALPGERPVIAVETIALMDALSTTSPGPSVSRPTAYSIYQADWILNLGHDHDYTSVRPQQSARRRSVRASLRADWPSGRHCR